VATCEASFGKSLNKLRVNCTQGWYELSPFQSYNGVQGTTSDGVVLNAKIPNQQAQQMDDDASAIMDKHRVVGSRRRRLEGHRRRRSDLSVAAGQKVKVG
jgi:glucose-fructose oxidoreductase